MSLGSITTQYLTDIANAIRTKLGVSTRYKPSQMAAAIASIPTGGSANLQTKTATYTPTTSQQTDTITPDAGYDGLDEVDVTVNAMPLATVDQSWLFVMDQPTMWSDADGLVHSSYENFSNPSVIYPITAAGYADTSVSKNVGVQITGTYQLPTKAAATYYPSTSDQYIGDDQFLTGQQTIKGVTTTNLTAANIKEGVTVQVGDSADPDRVLSVTGTYSGATNFVTGTFTTGSTAGADSVNLAYTGSGYPIAAMVVVEGGAYNSAVSPWYSAVQRYAVGQWTMSKSVFTSSPTYTTSGTQNQAVTTAIYKNSTSSSTSYTRTSAMSTNTFSSSNAANAAATCVRFKTGNVLSYYVNTSSYGLLPGTTYRYFVVYSE